MQTTNTKSQDRHQLLEPKFLGQRRILSLDGGGIRGLITLGMLEHLETQLRSMLHADASFRLCDYFDFVGGTSTGAIIAAGISIGKSVAELIRFYNESGALMFEKQALYKRLQSKYKSDPLKMKLEEVFKENTELGSDDLKTLLMIVTRNVTTDSPWPITNNPLAKYNDVSRDDCNLRLPLWQLVRASTAAPVYFPAEVVEVGSRTFVFVDGGVTPYNNPAFLLYRNVVAPPFKLQWETGEQRLLILSFGTGHRRLIGRSAEDPNRNLMEIAASIPSEMMNGMAYDQDINCRVVGRCVFGPSLDQEVGDLIISGPMNRQFTYARFDPLLDFDGLEQLGITGVDPEKVSKLDSIAAIDDMLEIGRRYGRKFISLDNQIANFIVN